METHMGTPIDPLDPGLDPGSISARSTWPHSIWNGSIGLSMSCWLLALVIAALASWVERPSAAPQAAAAATTPAGAPVTATGCLIREPAGSGAPPVGHEAGGASELALTQATLRHQDGRALNTAPRSAVPGSSPAGFGSGTTSEPVPGGRRPSAAAAIDQAFWLAGAKAAELSRYVGKRMEITGTLDDTAQAVDRTTSAAPSADAGSSSSRRSAASPTADEAAVSHPSAPSRAITVSAFRVLTESCS